MPHGQQHHHTDPHDMASWKPGSEPEKAKDTTAPGDFGVPVGTGPSRDRDYVSDNTRMSDPGAAQPPASEFDGVRTHGAGAPANKDGSASWGDLDVDFLGLGAGGSGIAAAGPRYKPGPDDSDGSSAEFASGPPAAGRNQTHVHKIGGPIRVPGSTTNDDPDAHAGPSAQGADAANNNQARNDDAFAGEVSFGEVSGNDAPLSPSSDSQGLSPDQSPDQNPDES